MPQGQSTKPRQKRQMQPKFHFPCLESACCKPIFWYSRSARYLLQRNQQQQSILPTCEPESLFSHGTDLIHGTEPSNPYEAIFPKNPIQAFRSYVFLLRGIDLYNPSPIAMELVTANGSPSVVARRDNAPPLRWRIARTPMVAHRYGRRWG